LIQQGVKDMTTKRVVLSSLALLVAIVVIGLVAARPIGLTTARQLSDRALSIIGSVDPAARVQPQDLQCNVKVGWGLAQCGSQASSCKNCHEVKGEDSVNAKGDWHVAHAFGDFCEFCHGGNVQATDKAGAHQGMVQPLDDVKTNCSSCHADDYQARAEKYAAVLGATVGASGSGSAQPPAAPSAPSQAEPQQPAQPAASQPAAAQSIPAAAPSSNEIVDYVAQYKVTQPPPPNTATTIISLLLVAVVVGGGAFVVWNEWRLHSKQRQPMSPAPVAATDERSLELAQLQPLLDKLDAQALRGLRTLLSNRR
jgi:hypothetical protein